MHVQFEYTREDLVDAGRRFINRRKPKGSGTWKTALYYALSVGVVISFLFRNNPIIGLSLGLIGAGSMMLIFAQLEKRGLEGRLRRAAAEMMPDPGPYVCEVEIRAEGVWIRQKNTQVIHEWPSVDAIEETSDSVDIFTRDGGGVVVRNRAFGSEGARSQFIELARSRLVESRS